MTDPRVAFLRAVNVGGRRVASGDLVRHLDALDDVTVLWTYLASGNVAFTSPLARRTLETRFAEQLEKALGFEVPTLVRSRDQLRAITESEVFADHAGSGRHKVYVTFLSAPPRDSAVLDRLSSDVDTFRLVDRDVFWLRDLEAGQSLDNYALEKALGIVGTRRSMTTIRRLVKKLA